MPTNEKCLDDSPLQGACCTNACQRRGECDQPRIPLLIYVVVKNDRMKQNYIDAYINDIVYLQSGREVKKEAVAGRQMIQKYSLKPWNDPESLFCDTDFLNELLGKDLKKKPKEANE